MTLAGNIDYRALFASALRKGWAVAARPLRENVGLSLVRALPLNEINAKQSEPIRGRRSCKEFRRKERARCIRSPRSNWGNDH